MRENILIWDFHLQNSDANRTEPWSDCSSCGSQMQCWTDCFAAAQQWALLRTPLFVLTNHRNVWMMQHLSDSLFLYPDHHKNKGYDRGVASLQHNLMLSHLLWVSRYTACLSALVLREADWLYVHLQQWSSQGPEHLWNWMDTKVNTYKLGSLDWRQWLTILFLPSSAWSPCCKSLSPEESVSLSLLFPTILPSKIS